MPSRSSIRFLPSNKVVRCNPGQSIFDVGWKAGVGIQSTCVSAGTCGLCRVTIVSGEEHLSPYNSVEQKHMGNVYHLTKRRLSCQSIIQKGAGEIVIEVQPKQGKAPEWNTYQPK